MSDPIATALDALPENVRAVPDGAALLALRADEDFHEGALRVLTYPTAPPVGFIGHDLPLSMKGQPIFPGPGVHVVKGEAGDFAVIDALAPDGPKFGKVSRA